MTADLTAAVARLRDECGKSYNIDAPFAIDVRLVLAALKSAQQDAARYRWLRERFRTCSLDASGRHQYCDDGSIMRARGPTFDAAIDAAMGEGDA